jgi:pimeloyl-ACP methyl ester carboxylesterase
MQTRTTTTPTHRDRVRRSGPLFIIAALLAVATLIAPPSASGATTAGKPHGPRPTIVLIHGDWADASSWNGVSERLQRQGYTVVAPPNPLRGPTSDAQYVAAYLKTIPGPIVVVAHSYGGFVATNAAAGLPNLKAMVYIDAFIPDAGQTLADLSAGSCVDPATGLNFVSSPGGVVDTYLRIEPNSTYTGFSKCFANGVNATHTAVLAAVQRPAALNQFVEPSGPPAWKTVPSWSLIGTADHVIPAASQQAMSTHAGAHISTVNTGHLSLVTRPNVVRDLIVTAVHATT